MLIHNGKPTPDEPKSPTGFTPSAIASIAATDPAKARRIQLANEARMDPDCNRLYSELCWHARAALSKEGVALTEAEKSADVEAFEAADRSTMRQEHVHAFDRIASELREKNWDAHR